MRKLSFFVIVLICTIFLDLPIKHAPKISAHSVFTYVNPNSSINSYAYHNHNFGNSFVNNLMKITYAAHRGAPSVSKEPENSLSAFNSSKKLGYKIVETDLQLTKDEQWIIMHDYSVDRTTNGKGKISDYTLKDIKKLRIESNNGENFPIPTLDDFLKICSIDDLIPILDIKPNEMRLNAKNYESLLDKLNKYKLLDKSIFCSYSKGVLTELRNRDKITSIAVMMDISQDNINFAKKLRKAFLYWDYQKLTADKIKLLNESGLRFGVWTINDEATAKDFINKGALIVTTDSLR